MSESEPKQDRTQHFIDTPENTFRTIGRLTPEEMAKVEKEADERYEKLLAENKANGTFDE